MLTAQKLTQLTYIPSSTLKNIPPLTIEPEKHVPRLNTTYKYWRDNFLSGA